MATIENNVQQNPNGYEQAHTSRHGTVYATEMEFAEVFGAAHEEDPSGMKVTKWWHFETPRGRATVRNWYRNLPNELSICSIQPGPAKWAAAYFRRCNIQAIGRFLQ